MAAQPDNATPLDVSKMSKTQKLAVLLVMVGPESAAQVLKTLEEQDLDAVVGEMTKLKIIPQEVQKDILQEFTGVAVEASTSLLGGVGYTQTALEKSV